MFREDSVYCTVYSTKVYNVHYCTVHYTYIKTALSRHASFVPKESVKQLEFNFRFFNIKLFNRIIMLY